MAMLQDSIAGMKKSIGKSPVESEELWRVPWEVPVPTHVPIGKLMYPRENESPLVPVETGRPLESSPSRAENSEAIVLGTPDSQALSTTAAGSNVGLSGSATDDSAPNSATGRVGGMETYPTADVLRSYHDSTTSANASAAQPSTTMLSDRAERVHEAEANDLHHEAHMQRLPSQIEQLHGAMAAFSCEAAGDQSIG
eukprot:TRINITY_DN26551_c1_g1_i1.p1 TRINITY_DN26551_c1_g1~~TRINITY_DN26551_c1_g1_i1.p1  ORF type:complete len:197 (-),score=26.33 TRINITY_DN26551_c1_g1_i1:129-719(-)